MLVSEKKKKQKQKQKAFYLYSNSWFVVSFELIIFFNKISGNNLFVNICYSNCEKETFQI